MRLWGDDVIVRALQEECWRVLAEQSQIEEDSDEKKKNTIALVRDDYTQLFFEPGT